MNEVKALDVSAYGGWHTDDEWRAAYDDGFRLAIVQAWGGGPSGPGKNPHCERLLAGARKAGMMTAIYFWFPGDDTTQTHLFIPVIKQAAGAEYEHIKFVAVDIEKERLHPTDPAARLKDAISHIDKPVVIYSSRHMWNDVVMGGISGFEQYPLWDALYDENPNLDAGWVPYGGWAQRAMKQYKGTTTVAGNISADLNVGDLNRLLSEPAPPPVDYRQKARDHIAVIESQLVDLKEAVEKI